MHVKKGQIVIRVYDSNCPYNESSIYPFFIPSIRGHKLSIFSLCTTSFKVLWEYGLSFSIILPQLPYSSQTGSSSEVEFG